MKHRMRWTIAGLAICLVTVTLPLIAIRFTTLHTTLLISSATYGNATTTRLLIQAGGDVNAQDVSCSTPLIWAARQQQPPEVVRVLLQAGANANSRDKDGSTPLMWAARQPDPEVVRLLLQAGANANARDNDGGTALMFAAGYAHLAAVRALLGAGADATLRAKQGDTAIAACLESGNPDSIECGELLANAHGLDGIESPFGLIQHGLTALGHAKMLIRHGVEVDHTAPDGWTPVLIFASEGNTEILSFLLEHGARVNVVAADGKTPLTEAVYWGHADAVDYLIQHGADTSRTRDGLSLLDIARRNLSSMRDSPAAIPSCKRIVHSLEAAAHPPQPPQRNTQSRS